MYSQEETRSYIVRAKRVYDIEDGSSHVEVVLRKYQPGIQWEIYTEEIYSEPKGTWTELIFTPNDQVDYVDFLNTMVHKNLTVARKIAMEASMRCEPSIRMMKCIRILDDTFTPPDINEKARWQRELVECLCIDWTRTVIASCKSIERLTRYQLKLSTL